MTNNVLAGAKPILKSIRTQSQHQVNTLTLVIKQEHSAVRKAYYMELCEWFDMQIKMANAALAKIEKMEEE